MYFCLFGVLKLYCCWDWVKTLGQYCGNGILDLDRYKSLRTHVQFLTSEYIKSVTGFDWDIIFIWALSWFTSYIFSWTTSLTGTVRGNAEVFSFLNIYVRLLNASLCQFYILTSGLAGSGFCSAYIK